MFHSCLVFALVLLKHWCACRGADGPTISAINWVPVSNLLFIIVKAALAASRLSLLSRIGFNTFHLHFSTTSSRIGGED